MQKNMADVSELKNDIKKYLSSAGYVEISRIHDDTLLFNDEIIDSIGFVHLVVFLEDRYRIKTADKDLVEENFETVNAIVKFVLQKQENNPLHWKRPESGLV